MLIRDVLANLRERGELSYSCEFFPPKTAEGNRKLRAVWSELALLGPQFFSVTYGAGGGTRGLTLSIVENVTC